MEQDFLYQSPCLIKEEEICLIGLNFVGKVNTRSTLNIVTHQENVFEFKLKDKTINIRSDDFILPKYRTKTGGIVFDHHTFFLEDNSIPARIEKNVELPGNRVKYDYQEQRLSDDFLVTKAEKDVKKMYFQAHESNLFQESYFLYDRSNLVKQSFVNKINRFLPIYCSASYFGEKTKLKIALLSPTNSKIFYVEKNAKKEELNLQIAKVNREEAGAIDKKIRNAIISRIGKKRKREMKVTDFITIRGQQSFEAEKTINPIEIKTENDQIPNIFDKSKKKQ